VRRRRAACGYHIRAGQPSYVELLTCPEVAKTSRQLPGEDRLNGYGGEEDR
jgi:hypothetical protein